MKRIVLDTECYGNFFLLSMMDVESGKVVSIRRTESEEFDSIKARRIMAKNQTISFNGIGYDLPLICLAIGGATNAQLKQTSDNIIKSTKPWAVVKDIEVPAWDHIDIMHVAPGQAGLKLYAGRLGATKLQGLPYPPDAILTPEQMDEVQAYCGNDLDLTALLYKALLPQIQLRERMGEKYGMDLRSKGDAQIAEAVLKHELEAIGVPVFRPDAIKSGDTFGYTPPEWISFNSPQLKALLDDAKATTFKIQPQGGVAIPEALGRVVEFDGAEYRIGIGGLHSSETCQAVRPRDDEVLFDADFASYYPAIILGEGYYPKHLGKKFLDIYKSIVARRLKAKAEKDMVTANSLKIVINSSFGKFGSKYSFLYSPNLLISVTLTGQLSLLMLIERITEAGARIVSANTDGIVVLSPKACLEKVKDAMFGFELVSGFTLEETRYRAIYSESVNNYIAVKPDGKIKGKGTFAGQSLSKNPQFPICSEAVRQWAADGTDIEDTIKSCTDPLAFCSIRKVAGGAVWQNETLGNVVRWYIGLNVMAEPIRYAKNGNRVPKTEKAVPLMDIGDGLPPDLDLSFYVTEAKQMMARMGAI